MSLRTTEFQSTRLPARTRCKTTDNIFVNTGFKPRVLAGGRDRRLRPFRDVVGVSIHASSREDATPGTSSACVFSAFQSTRPRGRTRPARSFGRNSQTPVSIHASSREDATCSGISGRLIIQVSIHASSREDATTTAGSAFICFGFNPRVLAGGRDLCVFLNRFISVRFQSTRPRGRTRHPRPPRARPVPSFNPRVLAGGRDRAT